MDRQGADVGPQYRSAIFYTIPEQKLLAEKMITPPMVTEIKPFRNFVKADDYHQSYFENNANAPYCQLVINPKLEKLVKSFGSLLK